MNPRALAESLDGHNVRLTLRGKTPKPEGTMAGCGEWGLTITSGIGGLIRYAYGEIDHIEDLGQPTPAAPASLTDHMVTIARARLLAADYQANPTPARAHNAAQVLGAVLDQLDAIRAEHSACAERLGESWAYGDKLEAERDTLTARLAAELDMPPLAELPDNAANHWTDVDPTAAPSCVIAIDPANPDSLAWGSPEGGIFTDADKPTTEQLADLVAKHMRPITEPLCHAPTAGLNCIYPLNHAGDHSVITLPPGYPIVVPADQLPPATGGIVDPNRTARIGEGS